MSIAFALVRWLATILPPTIHPMILHFPIVLLYVTAAIDVAGRMFPDRDRFLQRCGWWSLTLAAAATVATMVAGMVSESSVHFTAALRPILQAHQHFAILTGLSEGAAWLVRLGTRFPAEEGWSVFGLRRGRATWVSTLLVVMAAVFVTVTANLGGRMVYDHGAGVLGVTRTRV